MPWVIIKCPEGPYQLNPEGVTRIIRSFAYAKALIDNSSIQEQCNWLTSNVSVVNIDWDNVPKDRDKTIKEYGHDFYARLSKRMLGRAAMEYLEGLIDDRDAYTSSLTEMQRETTKKTMTALDKYVSRGERNIEVAKFIRNTAAETELALVAVAATGGAGLVSGESIASAGTRLAVKAGLAVPEIAGAAEGVAGVTNAAAAISEGASVGLTRAAGVILGSVGKGAIKWQDTGSIGRGVCEGAVELVINTATVGLKGVFKGGDNEKLNTIVFGLIFGVIKGVVKLAGNAYISPEDIAKGKEKSLKEILLPALSSIPSGAVSEIVKSLSNDPRWTVPATVLLKLGLKYGADALAKPSGHTPSGTFTGARTALSPNVLTNLDRSTYALIHRAVSTPAHPNAMLAGRQSLLACESNPLSDCAQLSEESTVMNIAFRPMGSYY